MSSLEQPLGLEKLPSLRTIERLDSFRSTSCSPRGVDGGMRECWIEGRSSGSSNSCSEDFEEYRRESFTWSRTRNEIFCRSSCLDHSNGIYGIKCDSPYFSYHQYNSFDKNGNGIKAIVHKVWKGIPDYVKIVEVGPRDGLQNEKIVVPTVPTAVKVELIRRLVSSDTRNLTELITAILQRVGDDIDRSNLPQILYEDEDHDQVVLASDSDLVAAVDHAKLAGWKGLKLHLDYSGAPCRPRGSGSGSLDYALKMLVLSVVRRKIKA